MAAAFVLVFPIGRDVQNAIGDGNFHGVARSWEWSNIPGAMEIRMGTFVDQITLVMLFVRDVRRDADDDLLDGYMHGDRRYGWFFADRVAVRRVDADAGAGGQPAAALLRAGSWCGLCSMLLIGYYNDKQSAAEAAKKAFITTRVGDVGLLIGIIILFTQTHTFNIQEILAHGRERARSAASG